MLILTTNLARSRHQSHNGKPHHRKHKLTARHTRPTPGTSRRRATHSVVAATTPSPTRTTHSHTPSPHRHRCQCRTWLQQSQLICLVRGGAPPWRVTRRRMHACNPRLRGSRRMLRLQASSRIMTTARLAMTLDPMDLQCPCPNGVQRGGSTG